jgi:hypothetical protein
MKKFDVRGYYKPESAFHTIAEWESVSKEFLELQKQGYDIRSGNIDQNIKLINLINNYFSYQLYIETEQYADFTRKKVLDFIEDFVNHRVWSLKDEFKKYMVNISNDKIAFFYSRGSIEPYVLMDDQFTKDTYGSNDIDVTSFHWTNKEGLINIIDSVQNGYRIAISTFTTQSKEFFVKESNILVKVRGKLAAAFESDAKTFATDMGHRAANMFRLSYPDHESNLCRDWQECKENKTTLWNELVVYPTEVLDYKEIKRY